MTQAQNVLPFTGTENVTLMESEYGCVSFKALTRDDAWETAIDAVDYPVVIRPAFYLDQEDNFVNGECMTNTGRKSQYQMVVVDKLRDGNWNPISVVSDTYGTLKTSTAYEELKDQLDQTGVDYSLKSLYVSGDGGVQFLNIQINDAQDMAGLPDKISLVVQFMSSVDGTKAHCVNLMAYNHTTDAMFDFSGSVQKLQARHTTTIGDRSINFIPAIVKIVKNWNENIVPFMKLMMDCQFDKDMALELVETVSEDAGIGERHRNKIVELYGAQKIRTNETGDNLYRVNVAIGQYIADNLSDKPEVQQRFGKGLGKAVKKAVARLTKK